MQIKAATRHTLPCSIVKTETNSVLVGEKVERPRPPPRHRAASVFGTFSSGEAHLYL